MQSLSLEKKNPSKLIQTLFFCDEVFNHKNKDLSADCHRKYITTLDLTDKRKIVPGKRMDKRENGRTDGQTSGRTNRWTNKRNYGRTLQK